MFFGLSPFLLPVGLLTPPIFNIDLENKTISKGQSNLFSIHFLVVLFLCWLYLSPETKKAILNAEIQRKPINDGMTKIFDVGLILLFSTDYKELDVPIDFLYAIGDMWNLFTIRSLL